MKKIEKTLLYAFSGILFIVMYYMLLHMHRVRSVDARLPLDDAYRMATENAFSDPLCIFPLDSFALTSLGVIGAVFLFVAIFALTKKRPKTERLEDNHLMTAQELKAYNKANVDPIGNSSTDGVNNVIYSKDIRLAIDNEKTNITLNSLVTAMTGAGKSFRFVAPNLLMCNSNFIVTDPSGELTEKYAKYMENNGYEVLIFSTTEVWNSLRYNPFAYIQSDLDIVIMVDTFIKNTTGKGEHSGEKFWIDCERLLLYAICGFLWHLRPVEEQNFENVLKMLEMAKIDENNPDAISELDILFTNLERMDPGNMAVSQYKSFKSGAGKSLKSILISVESRCAKLALYEMKYLTRIDELHLEKFADSKKVLFIQIPESGSSFNFIVSMLYSQLFMLLYSYAEKEAKFGCKLTLDGYAIKTFRACNERRSKATYKNAKKYLQDIRNYGLDIKPNKERKIFEICNKKGDILTWRGSRAEAKSVAKRLQTELKLEKCSEKCPNHVRLMLDEFANIGEIPDFVAKLSTIRKYEISCSIIIQTYGQLEKQYDKDADNIVGNCSTKLFFGSTDTKTIKWMQDLFGKKEIIVKNESYQANGNGSTSYNKQLVPLISDTKIKQLVKECIVMVDKQNVYLGPVYDTLSDPKFKEAMKTKGQFVRPENDFDKERLKPLRERESYKQQVRSLKKTLRNVNEEAEREKIIRKGAHKKPTARYKKEIEVLDRTDFSSKEYQNAAVKGLIKSLGIKSAKALKPTAESIVMLQAASDEEVFAYKTE